MSTLTPINGISLPALTDTPNISTAVSTGFSTVDSRLNPVFASTAARDSAIPSPTEGQECYVTATGEKYIYNGTTWVSSKPRYTAAQGSDATTSSGTPANVTGMSLAVEANSRYVIKAWMIWSGPTGSDITLQWTIPAGASGQWNMIAGNGGITSVQSSDQLVTQSFIWTTGITYGTVTGTDCGGTLGGYLITGGTAGTLQLQYSLLVNAGAIFFRSSKSWISATKV